MHDVTFRCSSIAKLMTEPRTKAEGPLSVGAKTHVRELALQALFGVEFEFSSRETEKGLLVEDESIALVNRVYGLSLTKNTERRTRDGLTGEPDLVGDGFGRDIKSAWSVKTYRAFAVDCEDKTYEWQARGYMALWDIDRWFIDYCLVDTPDHLVGYEPAQLHMVSHIPAHLRVTSWLIERDRKKEADIFDKIAHAKAYYTECLREFDQLHQRRVA
ncbi:MAG: hypothetical protein ACK40S_02975 [Burkholderiaceae bacterium]